jgi:2-keto-4-pentenoate hydratase/2-oxohepta-3-ene-1,7-dioic acid hydratase in catechol pathway
MRVVRVRYSEQTFYAAFHSDHVRPLDRNADAPESVPLEEVALERPVHPTKVVCVGLNYHAHARELGREIPDEPLLFLKPPSAVIGPGEIIRLPSQSGNVHYEGELAIVMGRYCRNAPAHEASGHIFGYTCANDVTARDLQEKDVQYTRAKGFDTFCPLGPCIQTELDPGSGLTIRTQQNGEVRQQGSTADMAFSPAELISFISGIMALNPGDVILTGTPPGVGPLFSGDTISVEIEGVGALENGVLDRD